MTTEYTAFENDSCLAAGPLESVITALQERLAQQPDTMFLLFDDTTGAQLDVDLRGTACEITLQLNATAPSPVSAALSPRGKGRPKLGVVAREVTLLPRHWDWLRAQPGSASATLRKLVERARKDGADGDRVRRAQNAGYAFMSAVAGNLPGFEEASRALFAANGEQFQRCIATWPADISKYAQQLSSAAFS